MTVIEFFDKTPIENAIGLLTMNPSKIIFVGDKDDMQKQEKAFNAFKEKINSKAEVQYRPIRKNQLSKIVEALSDIVENEEDIVFDLTGGNDLNLVAIGIVYQKYPQKNIRLQRFNIEGNTVTDCDNDGKVNYTGSPQITIEQNILLHGGIINNNKTHLWNLSDDFISDIEKMWLICKGNPGYWNSCCHVLDAANKKGFSQQNNAALAVCASISRLKHFLKTQKSEWCSVDSFLKQLQDKGLILDYSNDSECITYTYKNEQIKRCLIKAGNALELKVFNMVRNISRKDNSPIFNDAMNGVYIDWDGEVHGKRTSIKDTENEIDVMLMQGIKPVFISCKNGQVFQEELYKLETVAQRFGGRYAKKILVSTYADNNSDRREYFEMRAKDMGIHLISDVNTMNSDTQFIRRFNEIINNNDF